MIQFQDVTKRKRKIYKMKKNRKDIICPNNEQRTSSKKLGQIWIAKFWHLVQKCFSNHINQRKIKLRAQQSMNSKIVTYTYDFFFAFRFVIAVFFISFFNILHAHSYHSFHGYSYMHNNCIISSLLIYKIAIVLAALLLVLYFSLFYLSIFRFLSFRTYRF